MIQAPRGDWAWAPVLAGGRADGAACALFSEEPRQATGRWQTGAEREWMLADRGYDADWFRDALEQKGIKPCIAGRKSRSFPPNGVAAAPPSFAKSDGDRRVRDRRKRRRAERRSSASSVDRAGTGARRQPAGFVSLQLATSSRPTASRSQVIAIVRCGTGLPGYFWKIIQW